jgi:glycosyltransferase involved in cell wall biosynthesis
VRVVINTVTYYGKGEGVRTYTAGLLRALAASDADMEWHVVLEHADLHRLGLGTDPRFHLLRVGEGVHPWRFSGVRFAWRNAVDQALIPLASQRFSAAHYLDGYGPLLPLRGTPLALTVHDLIPLARDAHHPGWVRTYLGGLMRATLPRAAAILTVSASTARDVARLGAVAEERICVIPHGVDGAFHPMSAEERARTRAQYRIDGPYVIAVGTMEPRKNLARLVRAFAQAKQQWNLPHRLLIVGKPGWGYDDVLAAVRDTTPTDVRLLGYLPRQDIPPLVAAADALAYVSFDEGFGLPVLEAMACGTPVLTSRVAALEEVAGDAAVLVSPYDERAIAGALGAVCSEPALRERLRDRGLAQAARYRWSHVADKTIGVYKQLAGATPAAHTP